MPFVAVLRYESMLLHLCLTETIAVPSSLIIPRPSNHNPMSLFRQETYGVVFLKLCKPKSRQDMLGGGYIKGKGHGSTVSPFFGGFAPPKAHPMKFEHRNHFHYYFFCKHSILSLESISNQYLALRTFLEHNHEIFESFVKRRYV